MTPSLRFVFPTSIESRGRSTVMVIGPGFTMRRDFQLMKGKWLNNLDLTYGFRVSKYLSRYANAQVADLGGCENINRPECQHQGRQNLSWRFANSLDAVLRVYDRLSVGVTVMFMNNLLHQIPEQEVELSPGLAITLPASNVTHTAATWAIFDVSYDLFDWLSLSVGTSTYYGQLAPDSSYQTFFFNRYTNFYFDVTIPLDALYHQIKTWSGRGSARRQTAGAASPRGGAAGQL